MGADSDDELEQRVDQLEDQLSKMLPGRRGVLKGLGAAALGGAAVGGATGGAAGQSAAGQIGTESEPVDVEAASVAAQSVSTNDLNGAYPSRVRAITADGVAGTFDKNGGSPIQDAIDAINAATGNGTILIPDGTDTAGNLTGFDQMSIIGQRPKTAVSLSDTTVPLISTSGGARDCYWDRLRLLGPGPASGSESAIEFTSQVANFHIGRMWFGDWDPATDIIDMQNGGPFGSVWQFIRADNSTGPFVNSSNSGQTLKIGIIESYLNDVSDVVKAGGGQQFIIGQISVGGSADRALTSTVSENQFVKVGYINYETTGSNGGTAVFCRQSANTIIGHIRINSTTVDRAVNMGFDNGNVTILTPIRNDGTINNSPIEISKTPAKESWYFGPASDVGNTAGSSTGLVRSLTTAGDGNG